MTFLSNEFKTKKKRYFKTNVNSTLCALQNKHAPLKCKSLRLKPANQWFTPALNKLKLAKRHLERVWSRTHSAQDLGAFHSASNHYHSAIIKAERDYSSTIISSSRTNLIGTNGDRVSNTTYDSVDLCVLA